MPDVYETFSSVIAKALLKEKIMAVKTAPMTLVGYTGNVNLMETIAVDPATGAITTGGTT